MASKFLHEAQRGAKSGSIDLPLAIVAGLSVGFVAFMLPGDVLARAVEMSRLPEILPAAAPPLGAKARIALAVAAAGTTFAAVYFLLGLLGRERRGAKEPVWPEADTEREPETPRLRRSDIHPDAPARRPILAARELGEPAPATRREPEPVEPPVTPPAVEEEALELGGPGIEMLEPEPEYPSVADPSVADPSVAEPVFEAPSVAAPVLEAPPSVAAPVAAAPVLQPGAPRSEASIAELIARLERGLARRVQRNAAAPAPTPAPSPAPAPEAWGDDRLRSAIENLQKMAARAG